MHTSSFDLTHAVDRNDAKDIKGPSSPKIPLRTAQEGSLLGKKMKAQNYFLRLQPTNIEKTMMLNLGDVSFIT